MAHVTRTEDLALHLQQLYMDLRRVQTPGFAPGPDRRATYLTAFKKLATRLCEQGIEPEAYMQFVFRLYEVPYVNIASSEKTVAAFQAQEGDKIVTPSLKLELDVLTDMLRKTKQNPTLAVYASRGQISPLVLYLFCEKHGLQNSLYEEEARRQWFLLTRDQKVLVHQLFPELQTTLQNL